MDDDSDKTMPVGDEDEKKDDEMGGDKTEGTEDKDEDSSSPA